MSQDMYNKYISESNQEPKMKKFKIFAGLSGGFGGARSNGIFEFEDEERAMDYAFERACEIYDNRAGMQGLTSYEDIQEENPDYDEESLDEAYNQAREGWLSYHVVEIKD